MSRASTSLTIQRVLFNLLSRTRLLHPIVRRIWPAVRLEVGGHDLILHPADNATERFMWLRGTRREVACISRLTLLVAGKRSLIFDIGANCGAFTLVKSEGCWIFARGELRHGLPTDIPVTREGLRNLLVLCRVPQARACQQRTRRLRPKPRTRWIFRDLAVVLDRSDRFSDGMTTAWPR